MLVHLFPVGRQGPGFSHLPEQVNRGLCRWARAGDRGLVLISSNHGALGWDRQCAYGRQSLVWWRSHRPCLSLLGAWALPVAMRGPPAGAAPQCCCELD